MIEKGSVVEQGTHSELLARDGVYKQLVLRQLVASTEDPSISAPNNTSTQLRN